MNRYNPKEDPAPYIRFMAQDIPGGKWTACVICLLLFSWIPLIPALCA